MRNKIKGDFLSSFFKRSTSVFHNLGQYYKNKIVYRLFWGRSNLYRRVVHTTVFVTTLSIVVTGFTTGVFSQQSAQNTIDYESLTLGNLDYLEQGGSVQSILQARTTNNFEIITYKIVEGDTYGSIAEKFGLTVDSVKLSNLDNIDYFQDEPPVDKEIRLPQINGLLLKVDEGDTLEKVEGELTQGNRLDIIEINNLRAPDYNLPVGGFILIPDGLIAPPPPPTPQPTYVAPPVSIPQPSPSDAVFAGIQFVDPLLNCGGYGYSRGFSSWHDGVDLTRGGGCVISASAGGTVGYAGWADGGQGFMVRIQHGNGVETVYFHGNGEFYVQPGQQVTPGQPIMYMGCTGYCTGTHLHFALRYQGVMIDPAPFVPYWRP